MTRYALACSTPNGMRYLAAAYDNSKSGVVYTLMRTDACSYVTIEKASQVARSLKDSMDCIPSIVEVSY